MSLGSHLWLQTVHLVVPSALALQCLWDCISLLLDLHLIVLGDCILIFSGLRVIAFGIASQCLRDCTSLLLGLHLNVLGDCILMFSGLHVIAFGTASQCFLGTASQHPWDCILMSLGLQVSAERLAALNPRLYNFQVGNFDYTDEELHLGQLQGKSCNQSIYILYLEDSSGESTDNNCKDSMHELCLCLQP